MKKAKTDNKKKFFLLAFMCICWFLPYIYSYKSYYQREQIINAIVIIIALINTTVFYYLCKNSILRLLVMIAAIAGITVVINYRYMLTVCAVFVIIYVYKSSITENSKISNINEFLLILAPWISIVGIVINFESRIYNTNQLAETASILLIFLISFLIMMRCTYKKEFEAETKKLYRTIYLNSLIGVLASASYYSFSVNCSITFFPWFFFIALLIYEEDKILYFGSKLIINKIKAFLK